MNTQRHYSYTAIGPIDGSGGNLFGENGVLNNEPSGIEKLLIKRGTPLEPNASIKPIVRTTPTPMFVNGQRTEAATPSAKSSIDTPIAMASMVPVGIDQNLIVLFLLVVVGILLFKK